MATITTRAGKGSPLTNTEVDDNFSNLNSAKYESGSSPTFANSALINSSDTVNFTLDGASANSKNIYFKGDSSAQMGRIASIGTSLYFQLTDATNYFTINPGSTVINDSSVNHDFRVESNDNANMLFVDASTNQVSVGMSGGSEAFNVKGNMQFNHPGSETFVKIVGPDNRDLKLELRANDDNDAFIVTDDRVADSERLTVNAGGELVVNQTSADYDFRVESDGNANMLFVDAGNDAVGIGGTPNTSSQLTVDASSDANLVIRADNSMTFVQDALWNSSILGGAYWNGQAKYGATNRSVTRLYLGHDGDATPSSQGLLVHASAQGAANANVTFEHLASITRAGTVFNEDSHDRDFRVESDSNANMLFVDGGANKVGIGTNSLGRVFNVYHPTTDGAIKLETGGNASNVWAGIEFKTPTSQSFIYIPSNDSTGLMKFLPAASEVLALSNSAVVVNEQSSDVDFRVESANNANAFRVDAGTDQVRTDAVFVHDTNTGTQPFYITRTGGLDQGLAVTVDDNNVMLRSIQDETSGANFIFYSSNATTTDLRLLQLDYSAGSVFNEDGVNYQHVRMESDADTHAFYLNAVNGYIGMGAGASPIQPLTIGASSGSNLNYYSGTSNVISSSSGIKVSKAIPNDASAGSGLNLSNTSSTNGTMSPMLHFSALSASTTYSTTYAGIWGRKLANGTDANWNTGSIEFGTAHSAGINKRMELNYLGGLITTPLGGGHAVFNENSYDADFRVESDSNANMLHVDGGNNSVGIGTTGGTTGSLVVQSNSGAGGISVIGRSNGGIGGISFYDDNGSTSVGYVQGRADDKQMRFWGTQSGGNVSFAQNNTERLKITEYGGVHAQNGHLGSSYTQLGGGTNDPSRAYWTVSTFNDNATVTSGTVSVYTSNVEWQPVLLKITVTSINNGQGNFSNGVFYVRIAGYHGGSGLISTIDSWTSSSVSISVTATDINQHHMRINITVTGNGNRTVASVETLSYGGVFETARTG